MPFMTKWPLSALTMTAFGLLYDPSRLLGTQALLPLPKNPRLRISRSSLLQSRAGHQLYCAPNTNPSSVVPEAN